MIAIVIVLLICACVAIFFAVKYLKNKLRVSQVVSKSPVTLERPANFKHKLLHYSIDITSDSHAFGLFQRGRDFWIVNVHDQANPKNLRDLYPAFKGTPLGFITIPGKQIGNNAFFVFSSDGKVYNPFSISHPWRSDFLFLPNENPISVDGRPLDSGIANGLFSGNGPAAASTAEGAILFRFYYPGYYIEDSGCVASGTDAADHPGCTDCKPIKSCTNTKVLYTYPPVGISSFYKFSGKLYGISSDGNIYVLDNGKWNIDSKWTSIFSNIKYPETLSVSASKATNDRTKLYLMGADYDDGIPIFLIYEHGTRYIVDKHARKYDFFHFLSDKNITTVGNPLDITKAGNGEYDYIVLYSDGKVYGQTLGAENGFSRNVSEFEKVYPDLGQSRVISISSVNKWQNNTADPGKFTFQYYLVFFYDNGKWFEVEYDIGTHFIGKLGQTDKTSGKWNEWDHVKKVLSNLKKNQTFKLASLGWSVFVFDLDKNYENDVVYSLNNPPENWIDMLFCTGDDEIKTRTCVGVGEWKDYTFTKPNPDNTKHAPDQIHGFNIYEDYGVDIDTMPGTVTRKISLEKCLTSNSKANAIIYDQAESDCHVYDTLGLNDTNRDPTKSAFINPAYDAAFQNRFCVKHKPTGKYLFWDFTDPDHQKLSFADTCSYSGPDVSTQDNPKPEDVASLQRVLGSMWSIDSTGGVIGLRNLNGALGGYLIADGTMSPNPDGNFKYINNNFTNGSGTCFSSDGTTFKEGNQCNGEWVIESIPCTDSTTGYLTQFCVPH